MNYPLSETQVERHISRFVAYDGNSDMSLKSACIAASPLVGTYSGATQVMAKAIRRSVSTVENRAHAHWLYCDLRAGNRKMARKLWRALPASHWWLAWDIQSAGYNALYYLTNAYMNGWSGRGMLGEWDKDRQAGQAPLLLTRAKLSIWGLAAELLKQVKLLTEAQHMAILAVLDAFEERT